jgi:hypothetical protein
MESGVVGTLIVVDAEHQTARCGHRQRLRLHPDAERRAVADSANQRTDRKLD